MVTANPAFDEDGCIQSRKIDCQLIAATNVDLFIQVSKKQARSASSTEYLYHQSSTIKRETRRHIRVSQCPSQWIQRQISD